MVMCLAADAADPVALDGIAHVAFRVTGVAASREFYRKLGFEQAFELGSGATMVSYVKINDRQFIELYARATEDLPTGLMHLCFEMSDTDGLFEAYVKRGLGPTDKRKARAGNLLFNLRDAGGQVVEYTQYLPGSLHSNERGKHLGADRISTRMVRASASARAVAEERAFFEKLGFADSGGNGVVRLRLPGDSGQEIDLEAAASGWKPRIEFAVADVRRAAGELRRRGMRVRTTESGATVTDPDGVTIVFAAEASGGLRNGR